MEKINSLSITEITISGIKNYAEPRTFTFGNMNIITGHNGEGKSTIAEAIAYAITGVPFFGESALDRLYTMYCKDMSVTLSLVADGTPHTLVRTRRNDTTDISYDGYTIRQSQLTTMFGEKEVFLAIFNPLYFAEILGDKGRNLLERLLPSVTKDEVCAKLGEDTRAKLEGLDLSSPDALLDNLRAILRETEKTIIYTEGQRDLLGAQGIESHALLSQKQTTLIELDAKISALELSKTASIDFAALEEKRSGLYARYDEILADKSAENETARVTAAYELAKARYTRDGEVYQKLRPGTQCPICKQAITEQNLGTIKKAFAESMNAARDEGVRLKQRIAELQTEVKKNEDELADTKAKIQSVETDIEFGGLTPDEQWNLDALKKDAEMLRTEIAALEVTLSVTSEEKELELVKLRERANDERDRETAVKFYLEERANLIFSDFSMLNRVKIVLYDTVKSTGEAKSVFKLSYDGRPYNFLSPSEKKKAGLEISELMKKLTGRDYPVFIDDGEKTPVIDNVRPTGQIFIAQVVKNAPLQVQIRDNTQQKTDAHRKAA
jgi:DNA repair exonuclease SbcCD ATPase subunit